MAHVRQQIREFVVTALTGLPLTQDRVYPSRIHPVDRFPALLVYTSDETSESITFDDRYNRTVTLTIDIFVKASTEFDNQLDAIAVQVEKKIAEDLKFGDIATDVRLASFEVRMSSDGEKKIGRGAIAYQVDYETLVADPEIPA